MATLFLGCVSSADIKDETLNDRVKACGGGFSETSQASLAASLNKASLAGEGKAGIYEETKAIIFSEIDAPYRIKAYEDYITCIEKKWN